MVQDWKRWNVGMFEKLWWLKDATDSWQLEHAPGLLTQNIVANGTCSDIPVYWRRCGLSSLRPATVLDSNSHITSLILHMGITVWDLQNFCSVSGISRGLHHKDWRATLLFVPVRAWRYFWLSLLGLCSRCGLVGWSCIVNNIWRPTAQVFRTNGINTPWVLPVTRKWPGPLLE